MKSSNNIEKQFKCGIIANDPPNVHVILHHKTENHGRREITNTAQRGRPRQDDSRRDNVGSSGDRT